MSYLSLQNVNKIYPGNVQAVFDFSLEVEKGEFIVLVGPSGCGKSTTLRMIAGLEAISSGDMALNGRRINDVAPSDRGIAMVFQDYALYGNMTVYQNIGFSLTIKGENDDIIHERVMEVSETVNLRPYLNRYPKALSGGQRQRVAMGRSLAKQAQVLLMDEPLSNLDAKLRQQTRQELAILHHELSATIVYVTHDQIEAMTLADRIVVMRDGYIQQVGSPQDIYHYPANIFTAGFIGMPAINFVHGRLEHNTFVGFHDGISVMSVEIPEDRLPLLMSHRENGIVMGLRPENIYIERKDAPSLAEHSMKSVIKTMELLGAEYNAGLDIGGCVLYCRVPSDQRIALGQSLDAYFDVNKAHFFDEKTGLRISYENERGARR